jgi:hypothetical protein
MGIGSKPLLRGRPRSVTAQALELRECKIGITPFDCPRDKRIRRELRRLIGHLSARTAQRQHGGRQPDGAWAVPDDLAVDPLSPGLGMPSGVVDHPAQVRSSNTTIRSGSRTQ